LRHNFQNRQTGEQGEDRLDAKKAFEREVEAVSRRVDRFRVTVQRFFAGDIPMPPEELRDGIRAELRRLQASKLASSADRFRLGTVEAKFQSHLELFGKRLREREQGIGAAAAANRPELQHDARQGVVFGTKTADGAVEALYKGLYLNSGSRNPSMDLDRFRQHLDKQAAAIRAKTGCAEIQFRVAEEDGKMKIKARPIKKA
jgi:hypothetical protein